MEYKDHCCVRVYRGRDVLGHLCQKPPAIVRDGKTYCAVHDPVAVKERDKKRQARWDEEWRKKESKWAREAAALKALELIKRMAKDEQLDEQWKGEIKAVLRGLQKR